MAGPPVKLKPPRLLDWLGAETPDPSWLVDGLVPAGSLDMVSGPRKAAGKTLFAMHLSAAIAAGVPAFGTIKTAADGVPVLFMEEEGASPETRKRVLGILRGLGMDPKTGAGSDALRRLEANFRFEHHPRVKLDNPFWVAALCGAVKEYGIKLVVLDAITYMISGDENAKRDMSAVNDALFAMRQCGAGVLYLVHTNKQAQREDADPDLDVRGSSVLLDAYDAHFALRRRRGSSVSLLARYRDFEEKRYRVGWDFGEAIITGSLVPVAFEEVETERLRGLIGRLLPGVDYSAAELGRSFDVIGKSAGDMINSLVKVGLLVPSLRGTFRRNEVP